MLHPRSFSLLCFCFQLPPDFKKFSFWFNLDPIYFSGMCSLISMYYKFSYFPSVIYFLLYTIVVRKNIFAMISIVLSLLGLAVYHNIWSILQNALHVFEKNVLIYSASAGYNVLFKPVRIICSKVQFKSNVSVLIFSGYPIHCWKLEVLKFLTVIV